MSQEPTVPQGQEPEPQEPPNGGDDPNGGGQEPTTFDAEYVKQLRAEAAKHRTEAQQAKTKVQEYEDRDKTEQQKKDEAAAAADKRATDAETKLLRYEVAAAKGVPLTDAHRLVGSTKEELEADAEALAERLGGQQPAPDFGGGPRQPAPAGSMDDLIRRAAGRA